MLNVYSTLTWLSDNCCKCRFSDYCVISKSIKISKDLTLLTQSEADLIGWNQDHIRNECLLRQKVTKNTLKNKVIFEQKKMFE